MTELWVRAVWGFVLGFVHCESGKAVVAGAGGKLVLAYYGVGKDDELTEMLE